MNRKTIASKLKFYKIGFQILLLTLICIILFQNSEPVDVALLLWQVHIPLVYLLLGMSVMGALLMFLTVWWKGR